MSQSLASPKNTSSQETAIIKEVEVYSHDEVLQVRLATDLVRLVAEELEQVSMQAAELAAGPTQAVLDGGDLALWLQT